MQTYRTRPLGEMLIIGGIFFALTALMPWVLSALGLWILLGGA